jgi:hypothetical protein
MGIGKGNGKGGKREYRICDGSKTWPVEMYPATPLTRDKLSGKCGTCGKILILTTRWNIPIHAPLHVTVQMWEKEAGIGQYTDQDEGTEVELPEDV